MNSYPKSLEAYPKDWVNAIKNLNEHDQWRLDAGISCEMVTIPELKNLLNSIKEKSSFEKLESKELEFSDADLFKMKDKKRHEIKKITGFLKNKSDLPDECIDIGGGIGHLSRTLVNKLNKKSVIIESNDKFCEIGEKVNQNLGIKCIDYRPEFFDKNLSYHQGHNCFTLGLHACGDLSSDIIDYTVKNNLESILSFGCCYFKTTYPYYKFLSQLGSTCKINLSKYSLTLASRAHTGLKKEDFLKKKKVKSYRYALHLYLYHHLNHKDFKEVGESKFTLYQGDFSSYANEKLNYLGVDQISPSILEDFFHSPRIQEKISSMFCANIIRWQFGRAIEKLVLFDRAIYLKENNYDVEVGELFDEKISPRNIGIFAKTLS